MKITNIASALLFVSLTNAHSDFIKDGNRAKLFELMDKEVPNFKVYLPEDELEQLKKEIGYISAIHDPAIAEEARNQASQWGNWGDWGNAGGDGAEGGENPFAGMAWGTNAGATGAEGAAPAGGFQWGGAGATGAEGAAPAGGFQWGGAGAAGAGAEGAAPAGGFQWGGAATGAEGAEGQAGGFDFANFNFEDFFNNTDFDWSSFQKENFKVKDAKMDVEINGQKLSFDKVTFAVGGSSSRTYARQAFNLKIRGKKDLFGRNQFRIRSDNRDATYLRSKLACDIHNRLGIPSISANYISLYVNDEYWGFYVFFDSPKPSWAELVYGDKDSTHVYKCKNGGNTLTYDSCATRCMNEDEEVTDHTEWGEMLTALDNASSAEDIEDIFDVDQFLIEMIYEYLSGSWDHFLSSGHNFSMYKMPQQYGGKWTMLLYDFDADFGQDVCSLEFMGSEKDDKDYPSWAWSDWNGKPRHIVDILINNHPERFNAMMKKIVEEVFNPDVLFPHIDELKEFIRPYVLKDKTPVDGKKPGMLNENASSDDYSMEHWDANSEFTNIGVSTMSSAYGLKFWILERYRKVCKDFENIDCIDKYLDPYYYYEVDRSVEGPINTSMGFSFFGGAQEPKPETTRTTQYQPPKTKTITQTVTQPISQPFVPTQVVEPVEPTQSTIQYEYDDEETTILEDDNVIITTPIPVVVPTSSAAQVIVPTTSAPVVVPTVSTSIEYEYDDEETTILEDDNVVITTPVPTAKPTTTAQVVVPTTPVVVPTIPAANPSNDCLAAYLGYPCCKNEHAISYYFDEYGDWSVENNQWCGITNPRNCWAASLGYPCCSSCSKVWLTDSDGNWGVENNEWCGLATTC